MLMCDMKTIKEARMIKVSVLYPQQDGVQFDMDYYLNRHITMVQERLGDAIRGVSVEAGLGGVEPGSPPTYVTMGHILFDSVEAFQAAFGPHAPEILGDIPNYSNVQPVIQISAIEL